MARRKTTRQTQGSQNEQAHILDTVLPFPDDYEGPLAEQGLRVILNRKSLEIVRKAYDELIVSRRIPDEDEDISVTDVITLYILDQDKRMNYTDSTQQLTGEEAAYKASRYYHRLRREAQQHAYIIGMTYKGNDIERPPAPYDADGEDVMTKLFKTSSDDESLSDDDGEVINWLAQDYEMPRLKYDLRNPFERRLKQMIDIFTEAGPMFYARLNSLLQNDLAKNLREMGLGEDVDEAGFRSQPSGEPVSDPASS